MADKDRVYMAIDLKSFYASVECVERELDPLTTNLVVADASRTEKTICLAVSPSLKAYGIPGRARLFEVTERVKEINGERRLRTPKGLFAGESWDDTELKASPQLSLAYITALPRMALYIKYSVKIYGIYLKYIAPEDIHVYSIDEVFIDVTDYLKLYRLTAHELAKRMIQDVLRATGITATAGIGTNLYLCKVAMDIMAKRVRPDENGMRIASLDETAYRQLLWDHRPITDFWRVGRGYARKLEQNGMFTMGDVARCSVGKPGDYYNEELLYRLFGVNAELLIDHAWGWESCSVADVKAYKPRASSLGSGQVLQHPYDFIHGRLIVREMTELLSFDLLDKRLVTDQIVLTVGYDINSLADPEIRKQYKGPVTRDHFGRRIPKHAHGTVHLERPTSSTRLLIHAVSGLYDRIVDQKLLIRRVSVSAGRVIEEAGGGQEEFCEQMELFTDYKAREEEMAKEEAALERERKMQKAMLDIKKRFGKNAVLKGMNLEKGAMTVERNKQIGGHRA